MKKKKKHRRENQRDGHVRATWPAIAAFENDFENENSMNPGI